MLIKNILLILSLCIVNTLNKDVEKVKYFENSTYIMITPLGETWEVVMKKPDNISECDIQDILKEYFECDSIKIIRL